MSLRGSFILETTAAIPLFIAPDFGIASLRYAALAMTKHCSFLQGNYTINIWIAIAKSAVILSPDLSGRRICNALAKVLWNRIRVGYCNVDSSCRFKSPDLNRGFLTQFNYSTNWYCFSCVEQNGSGQETLNRRDTPAKVLWNRINICYCQVDSSTSSRWVGNNNYCSLRSQNDGTKRNG